MPYFGKITFPLVFQRRYEVHRVAQVKGLFSSAFSGVILSPEFLLAAGPFAAVYQGFRRRLKAFRTVGVVILLKHISEVEMPELVRAS